MFSQFKGADPANPAGAQSNGTGHADDPTKPKASENGKPDQDNKLSAEEAGPKVDPALQTYKAKAALRFEKLMARATHKVEKKAEILINAIKVEDLKVIESAASKESINTLVMNDEMSAKVSALHVAMSHDCSGDIIRFLLTFRPDLNINSSEGATPLIYGVMAPTPCSVIIAQLLLDAGADLEWTVPSNGGSPAYTAEEIAVKKKLTDLLPFLIIYPLVEGFVQEDDVNILELQDKILKRFSAKINVYALQSIMDLQEELNDAILIMAQAPCETLWKECESPIMEFMEKIGLWGAGARDGKDSGSEDDSDQKVRKKEGMLIAEEIFERRFYNLLFNTLYPKVNTLLQQQKGKTLEERLVLLQKEIGNLKISNSAAASLPAHVPNPSPQASSPLPQFELSRVEAAAKLGSDPSTVVPKARSSSTLNGDL